MPIGMIKLCLQGLLASVLILASIVPATAACTIENTSCYPWRIEQNESDTILLEVIPSNAVTSAIYRVCVCPPAASVSLVFDFFDNKVQLGTIKVSEDRAVCRDFRIQTARKSRLSLRRVEGTSNIVEGCYTTN